MSKAGKSPEQRPSLRISHIVYGRTSDKSGRVLYLVDPKGEGDERDIPEGVVLRRWRRRRFPGHVFSGERLSSTVWRAIPALLGTNPESWLQMDVDELRRVRESKASTLRERNLTLPAAETMASLFAVCGPRRLKALIERHGNAERTGRSGVPDLFLFSRNQAGRPTIARFVEVKKPEERVSKDQLDEIAFMHQLGLHARVLRLIERDQHPASPY